MDEPRYYFVKHKTKKHILLIYEIHQAKVKRGIFKKRELTDTDCYSGYILKENMHGNARSRKNLPITDYLSIDESKVNSIDDLSIREVNLLTKLAKSLYFGDYKVFIEFFLKGKNTLLANKLLIDEFKKDELDMAEINKEQKIPKVKKLQSAKEDYQRIMGYRGEFKNGWFIHHKNSLKISDISAIKEMDEFLIKFIFQQESIKMDEVHPEDLVLIKERLFKKEIF